MAFAKPVTRQFVRNARLTVTLFISFIWLVWCTTIRTKICPRITYATWFTHSDFDGRYYRHLTVLFVAPNDIITPLIDPLYGMLIYTSNWFFFSFYILNALFHWSIHGFLANGKRNVELIGIVHWHVRNKQQNAIAEMEIVNVQMKWSQSISI